MSGALWFFFWTESDWTGVVPPPTPAPTPDSGAGSGKSRKKTKTSRPPYIRAPEDFWEVRERYLRSIQAETTPELPPPVATVEPCQPDAKPLPDYAILPRYVAERSTQISTLRLTTNLTDLQAAGARLIELNRTIAVAERLRLNHIRRREVERRIRGKYRQIKRLALLSAAKILLQFLRHD